MDTSRTKALISLIERYKHRGEDAEKVLNKELHVNSLVIAADSYNIHLHLDEYPELCPIVESLVEYVKESASVKILATKKSINEELDSIC